MEPYIPISHLNDFIFCPRSVYLHSIYSSFAQGTYHQAAQTVGKIKHENIEKGLYSSARRYLQNMPVYSEDYHLAGRIDVYDREEEALIERKNKIAYVYDGYRYQLYAQYFCLTEMGYPIKKLYLHSLRDNKRYSLELPTDTEKQQFKIVLEKITLARAAALPILKNKNKCTQCIYKPLCH